MGFNSAFKGLKWILENETVDVWFGGSGLGPVTGTFVMFCTYTFALDRLKKRLSLQEDCIHASVCLLECKVALNW